MTDTLIEQWQGVTIFASARPGPAIPYGPVNHQDGTRNHGFIDLRAHPELIDTTPEVAESPGLRSILRAINASGSPLMSLGCERALFPVEEAPPGGPAWHVGSYVDLTYRDADANSDREAVIALARTIAQGIEWPAYPMVTVEVCVQQLRHFWGRAGCYGLMLKPHGYGVTQEEANATFEALAEGVAASIVAFAAGHAIGDKGNASKPA